MLELLAQRPRHDLTGDAAILTRADGRPAQLLPELRDAVVEREVFYVDDFTPFLRRHAARRPGVRAAVLACGFAGDWVSPLPTM
ncbi:MAG: hypothetical protein H6733_10705 [Alphaproteobacteria bacterium]|nr:hypothetical protein [Alphaproteobacteria bacterium]